MCFVLSHDFRLVEREFVVMLVVDMGYRKQIMAVWAKAGRGAVVGPGTIPKSAYSLFFEGKEGERGSSQGITSSRRRPLIMVVDGLGLRRHGAKTFFFWDFVSLVVQVSFLDEGRISPGGLPS